MFSPLNAEIISDLIVGKTHPVGNLDIVKAMADSGVKVQWIGKTASPIATGPFIQAYWQVLKDHPELQQELVQAYADAFQKQLNVLVIDPSAKPSTDAPTETATPESE